MKRIARTPRLARRRRSWSRRSSCAFTSPTCIASYRGLAMAGLVVTVLYALSQWRDIGRSFQGTQRQVRLDGGLGACCSSSASSSASTGSRNRQNKRWDLTANEQFSLSDQTTTDPVASLKKPVVDQRVLRRLGRSAASAIGSSEYTYLSKQVTVELHRRDREPARGAEVRRSPRCRPSIVEYDGRTERATSTDEQAHHQRAEEADRRARPRRSTSSQGHGEHDPTSVRPAGLQRHRRRAQERQLRGRQAARSRRQARCPTTRRSSSSPVRRPTSSPPELDAAPRVPQKGGKLLLLLDPPDKARRRRSRRA